MYKKLQNTLNSLVMADSKPKKKAIIRANITEELWLTGRYLSGDIQTELKEKHKHKNIFYLCEPTVPKNLTQLFRYFEQHQGESTDYYNLVAKRFIHHQPTEWRAFLQKIIFREITLGVDIKIINQIREEMQNAEKEKYRSE